MCARVSCKDPELNWLKRRYQYRPLAPPLLDQPETILKGQNSIKWLPFNIIG